MTYVLSVSMSRSSLDSIVAILFDKPSGDYNILAAVSGTRLHTAAPSMQLTLMDEIDWRSNSGSTSGSSWEPLEVVFDFAQYWQSCPRRLHASQLGRSPEHFAFFLLIHDCLGQNIVTEQPLRQGKIHTDSLRKLAEYAWCHEIPGWQGHLQFLRPELSP